MKCNFPHLQDLGLFHPLLLTQRKENQIDVIHHFRNEKVPPKPQVTEEI